MSDSSQPKNSYETLTINSTSIDDILKSSIDLSGTGTTMNDITFINSHSGQTFSYSPSISSGSTYTVGTSNSIDTITISGIDSYSAFNVPVEWVDCLPPFSRVQDMCEKYPGLKIAFENFKVFYEMVKDDYDNPTPKK